MAKHTLKMHTWWCNVLCLKSCINVLAITPSVPLKLWDLRKSQIFCMVLSIMELFLNSILNHMILPSFSLIWSMISATLKRAMSLASFSNSATAPALRIPVLLLVSVIFSLQHWYILSSICYWDEPYTA